VIAGSTRRARGRDHLRLVSRAEPTNLPPVLTDPAARKEFEQLTQALLDAAIEILDLADGEPDTEPNGDEFENDDAAI
jgi:hypothetical protein